MNAPIRRVLDIRLTGVLLTCLTALAGSAAASTFTYSNGTNLTLGTAQQLTLAPDLVIGQVAPNFTLATAQPVSPQYMAYDVLGTINASHPQEFFGFGTNAGDAINTLLRPTNPTTQLTELLLYDNFGNLVAIAAGNYIDGVSSAITFPVISGGTWFSEATSTTPATYQYDLRYFSPFASPYTIDVFGSRNQPTHDGFYSIGANVGDNLHLFLQATTSITMPAELLLYDPNGNLVAIANGNGPGGLSSIIDFTVPAGDAGNWTAQVTSVDTSSLYKYDLTIQGSTGVGPVNPFSPPGQVPEPSSLLLIGTGLAAAAGALRRRLRA